MKVSPGNVLMNKIQRIVVFIL